MGFFADGSLPDGKTRLRPVPATADPASYVTHTEWNALCAGVKDLRTNIHKATTKGDILVYDGTTYQRLPVGTNGHVLTADSTVATVGVKWAAGGAAGTLSSTYSTTTPASNTITVTAAGEAVVIKNAASPLGMIFSVQSNGADGIFSVTPTGITIQPPASASGTANTMVVAAGAHTSLTASADIPDIEFALNRTVNHATGALATQRAFVVRAPTYSFTGASTLTTAATMAITGAPAAGANATITDAYALWVQAGTTALDGGLKLTGTITGSYTLSGAPKFSSDFAPTTDNAVQIGDDTHRVSNVYTLKISTALAQQHTVPSVSSDTIALLAATQTFTNKTLTAPVLGGTVTGTYTLGGTPTVDGYGYIGQNSQAGLGTFTTTSSTFVDVGDGSTTGYATWTTPSLAVAKTYLLFVRVDGFQTSLSGMVSYQVVVDGSAPGGQPTNGMQQIQDAGVTVAQQFVVPLSLGTGTHTIKLQVKTSAGTYNVNTNGRAQMALWN